MFVQDKDIIISPNPTISVGPRADFSESFSAAFDDQSLNNSSFGARNRFKELEQANLDKIYEVTGKRINLSFDTLDIILGKTQHTIVGVNTVNSLEIAQEETQQAIQQINELSQQFTGIKSYDDLLSDLHKEAAEVETRQQKVNKRSGASGVVGSFAGGVTGSFTINDPVNIFSLGFGGAGKTLATRILTEAEINAGVEFLNQFGFVNENRRIAGLRELTTQERLTNVAFAGVGAGALRGTFEGVGAGVKKIAEKSRQLKIEKLKEALDSIEGATPTQRAVSMILDQEFFIQNSVPFNKTRGAQAVHEALLSETYDKLNRPFDPDAHLGSNADRADIDAFFNSRGLSKAEDFKEISSTETNVIGNAEKLALEELDNEIRPELIARAGNKLNKKDFEALKKEQKDLQFKIDTLEKTKKADIKRENKKKNVTRKQAEKNVREATKESEAIIQEKLSRINDILSRHEQAKAAASDLTKLDNGVVPDRYKSRVASRADEIHAVSTFKNSKPQSARIDIDSVNETETRVHENLENIVENTFDRAVDSLNNDTGKVDIGLKEDVDLDATVKTVDAEGNINGELTIKQVLQDLKEDDALVKALKECTL